MYPGKRLMCLMNCLKRLVSMGIKETTEIRGGEARNRRMANLLWSEEASSQGSRGREIGLIGILGRDRLKTRGKPRGRTKGRAIIKDKAMAGFKAKGWGKPKGSPITIPA